MRRKIAITFLCAGTALLLAACGAKDDSNTDHPDQGQITLTTDWTERTAGIDIPANYTVTVGEYSATVSNATSTLDHLFDPDTYHLRVYNTPEHISINEATVTVAQASGNVDGVGQFVQEMPGWLFTSTQDAAIEADTDYELTAAMQQQVRQLMLFIEPTGGTTDRIERIEGYLSGAASTLNMDDGTHGTPLNVALSFAKVADGANAGKWAVTVRLLGVAGTGQKLHAQIFFEDDTPKPVSLTDADGNEGCDLTEALADFNKDKKTPLALGGKIVETPTSTGFTATFTDWTPVKGGSVVAN
ncbi:FimB/Mfa2 family fimbrial subunit [Phocaeicola sp.]